MTDSDRLTALAKMLENLLDSRVGVVEASRYIASSRFAMKQETNPLFLPFVGIDSETDEFPLGAIRARWAKDALSRYDQERELAERRYISLAMRSATDLLAWIRSQLLKQAATDESSRNQV